MSEKLSYDDIIKLYSSYMDRVEDEFFISGSHGWTKEEFLDKMKKDQQLVLDYYKLIKPLIDNGMMYLN